MQVRLYYSRHDRQSRSAAGAGDGASAEAEGLWVVISPAPRVTTTTATFNTKNLRGQALLFRCLETGFVTTAPALTRYQQGRGIDPERRELVGERPASWIRQAPSTTCEHCGMVVRGNQWAFRQHQQSKKCLKTQQAA